MIWHVWYDEIWYDEIWWDMMWYEIITLCSIILYDIILNYTKFCNDLTLSIVILSIVMSCYMI